MKRVCSRFLVVASLGCLVALWTLPASAYYQSLQATATASSAGVQYHVWDPRLQKDMYGGSLYYPGCFVQLQQENGVIAWVLKATWINDKYYVYCAVYDPGKADFVEDLQGPFDSISQLTVKDGMVAYVVPNKQNPGYQAAMYTTYDPLRGWMKSSYDPPSSSINLVMKDGLVVFIMPLGVDMPQIDMTYDIYDPKLGKWAGGSGEPTNHWSGTATSLHISNATIYFNEPITDPFGQTTNVPWVIGYRPDYQMPFLNPWSHSDPTNPFAYFVAQPTSDFIPLWVWFTDMSIAGTKWNWNYGEGNPTTLRSPFHVYNNDGDFTVTLSLNDGASTYQQHIYVGWVGMILRNPEIVKQLALKKGGLIKELQGINNPQEVLTILQSHYGEKPPPQLRSLYNVLKRQLIQHLPGPPGG